jgi:uncharacterized membrane protein
MTLTDPAPAPIWPSTWRTRSAFWWILLSALGIAVFAPLPYAFTSLAESGASGGVAATYATQPAWVQVAFYLHITAGGTALLLSPFQFATRLRDRHPQVHRVTGRIALTAIVVGGCAGLVLAPHSLAGSVGTAGFGLLAVLWVTFALTAFRAIRRGDIATHRRWMVRTFALTYAAVTLRLELGLMIALQISLAGVDEGLAFERAYLIVPFLCWVPNLLVAERYLATRSALAA